MKIDKNFVKVICQKSRKSSLFLKSFQIGRFSDDITMPIVWFLLQFVVKFARLNQW